jgi:hypothetical protein
VPDREGQIAPPFSGMFNVARNPVQSATGTA